MDTAGDLRPKMPRAIAALVIGAIALASLAALVWPQLPVANLFTGPTEVGVVRRVIADPNAAPRISGVAPDFEWNAPSGKTQKLSDLRGRVVVLTFWATWCEPCRREFPAMQRVAASTDAVFIAVDLLEDGSKVRSFMDALALDRIDPLLDTDGALTRAYAAIELPQTFFIDARGVIQHIERGELDEAGVRRGIDKAR
ncbi:MAG TPA: TlpA disulfide reductase family protein [Candidatus Limnocylindria bacterium]|nr:TlpA disulfide reductase family protein [Candidatus Limnocylindria bacterium]